MKDKTAMQFIVRDFSRYTFQMLHVVFFVITYEFVIFPSLFTCYFVIFREYCLLLLTHKQLYLLIEYEFAII